MQKWIKVLSIISLLNVNILFAQKVGLVLSGGGARGFAHIGVIKALEENGIPIDFITGTSAGASCWRHVCFRYQPTTNAKYCFK